MTTRRVQIGRAVLWQADWREIAVELAGHAAVITDATPARASVCAGCRSASEAGPAAVVRPTSKAAAAPRRGLAGRAWRSSGGQQHALGECGCRSGRTHGPGDFDPEAVVGMAPLALVWGVQGMGHRLPEGSMLVWDRMPAGRTQAQPDGEAAWDSRRGRALRIFRLAASAAQAGGVGARQRPVELMRWTIMQAGTPASILDPFMGCGAIGVAAVELGLAYTGVEADAERFERACERISRARPQMSLFEPPGPSMQRDLFHLG